MTATVDPIKGVIEWLRLDEDVAALAASRVYFGRLPDNEKPNMPRPLVTVQAAGGGFLGGGYQDYGDRRLDVDCYGSSDYQAWLVHLAVRGALKHLRRQVSEGVLLHWARPSSEGIQGRDPETDWPVVFASFQLLASEVAAA